jgi:ubiquinone/menaquinone biosynthesis C-methylase UbiE
MKNKNDTKEYIFATHKQILDRYNFSSDMDQDFFVRVFSTPIEVYEARLSAIGFKDIENALDAGCGFGQWALTMATLNGRIHAFDNNLLRLNVLQEMASLATFENIIPCQGLLDHLPYKDSFFDGVFCYSALHFVNYHLALREFHRVLRRGGKLYFMTNDFGWYLYNFVVNHNPSKDFSPRLMAIHSILNTIKFWLTGKIIPGAQLAIPIPMVKKTLYEIGFSNVRIDGDGKIGSEKVKIKSFFPKTKYGLPNVFEVLCEK